MKNPNNIFKNWYTIHELNNKKFDESAFVLSTVHYNGAILL